MFISTELNEQGLYELQLYIQGIKTRIIVDEFFPVTDDRYFSYVRPKKPCKSIWMMLVEKAIAKAYGGYENIRGQKFKEDVFYCMTGQHQTSYNFQQEGNSLQRIWEVVSQGMNQNYPMVISAKTIQNLQNKRPQGIVLHHQYSLLGNAAAYSGNQEIKLLHLRNPWGNYEWNKEWSRNSPLWPPKEKERLKVDSLGEGQFYIPLQKIKTYYQYVKICEHRSNLIKKGVSMNTYEGGFACLYLDTSQTAFYDLRCSLLHYNVHELDGKLEPCYRIINFKLFQQFEPGQYLLVLEQGIKSTDAKLTEELRIGSRYLIIVEVEWLESDTTRAVHFDVASKYDFELEAFKEVNVMNVIYHILKSNSKKNINAHENQEKQIVSECNYNFFHSIKSLFWKNQTIDLRLHVTYIIQSNSELIFIPSPDPSEVNNTVLKFQLKPQEEKFLLFKEKQKNSQFQSTILVQSETQNIEVLKRKIIEIGSKKVLMKCNSGNIMKYVLTEGTGFGHYFQFQSSSQNSIVFKIFVEQDTMDCFNFFDAKFQTNRDGTFEFAKTLKPGEGMYVITRYKNLQKKGSFGYSYTVREN